MKNIFFIILACLFINFQTLPQQTNIYKENIVVTGDETGNSSGTIVNTSFQSTKFNPVTAGDLTYNFVSTSLFTGYDFQSNATPQQIWQDPVDPNLIYMVFTTSFQTWGWTDRNGRFLFSDDMGNNWQDLGNVQTGTIARGGFITISGLNDGRPVAGLHTNDEITATRTQIYVRNSLGNEWTRYNPGPATSGETFWPRVLGIGVNHVVFTSSVNGAPDEDFYTNTLSVSNGTFSGWNSIIGDQAETYNLAKTDDESIIGLAYVGNGADEFTFGNLYYRQSLDGGANWGNPLQVYTYGNAGDSLGAMRGMDIIFLEDEPYVVFEVMKQDYAAQSYTYAFPNKIMLWSPALNSGVPVVIADSNNIPYFEPFNSTNDVFGVLCRPSIGKSADNQALFITINAATEHFLEVSPNRNTYYAGYFMYSTDGGITFSDPEKFTPELPLRDWRYISLNPVNYVDPQSRAHVLMSAQSDTIPGSTVNALAGFPVAVSAELIFISTEIQLNPGSPFITLTSPNGGENWAAGTTKEIRWISSNVNNVKVEYTTNSGSSWLIIVESIPNTGIYPWSVPNTISNACKVRITDMGNPGVTDISNNNFNIVEESITVINPNGGELLIPDNVYQINWQNQFVSFVKIEYSTNSGASWITINDNTPATGSYNWMVPLTPSFTCLLRISSVELPSVFDESNDRFTIVQKSLSITSPNGGENWKTGSVHNITWNSSYVSSVGIQYSRNSGTVWVNVTNSTPGTGSYTWTIPNSPSTNCLVRIFDPSNAAIADTSDDFFAIVAPTINVTSPNGGEIWLKGSSHDITWTSNDISNVKLELSLNNGIAWTEIISSTPSTGSYNWLVPETQSTQCLIRITDVANPTVSDKSDNVFTIQGTSGIDELFNEIPVDFSLQQNFPNPFNPSTTIVYGIPEGSNVSLSIFNLLGEKIADLVEEYKEPGYYKVNFNFERFNSGIYLYKIKAGEFVQTKKMILLK